MSSWSVPRLGMGAPISVKLRISRVEFTSRKNGLLSCLSGREMRLNPVPTQVPGSSSSGPRSGPASAAGALARNTAVIDVSPISIQLFWLPAHLKFGLIGFRHDCPRRSAAYVRRDHQAPREQDDVLEDVLALQCRRVVRAAEQFTRH